MADKLVDRLSENDDRAFWKEIKNINNSKVKLPNIVGNANGNVNITAMWYEHCSSIFDMVPGSSCNDLLGDLCGEHCEFDGNNMIVLPSEMVEMIMDLACNKSPGLDGLNSEHMQLSSVQLPVLISILISVMLIHGCIPKHILTSVMVPIIKNKNKSSTDKNNYRPICISNVFTKIVEKILYRRMEKCLRTTSSLCSHNQALLICMTLIQCQIYV